MDPLELAEAFHLAFLSILAGSADPRTFALKGGGNIRFYFGSLRFSEDIDLDTFVEDPRIFSQKVERAFNSPSLAKLLGALGISVSHLNPKDRTATKEKWVIGLDHADVGATAFTRVEISHRAYGLEEYVVIEPVPGTVIAPYPPLVAPTIGHYQSPAAISQKTDALRDRRHTQPRDVFDLDHIFRKYPDDASPGLISNTNIDLAIARIFELEFGQYRSKVVTFLDASVRTALDNPAAWEAMQLRVATRLERLKT